MKFRLIESTDDVWYHDKQKFSQHISKLVKNKMQYINKQLDDYGFEVTYVENYDFDPHEDWVAVFCGEIQNNASEFPISINTDYLYQECLNDEYMFYDLGYHIEKSIWHEVGHGIQNYLYPDYDFDDIEGSAEEFAEYMMNETYECEILDYLKEFEENNR